MSLALVRMGYAQTLNFPMIGRKAHIPTPEPPPDEQPNPKRY